MVEEPGPTGVRLALDRANVDGLPHQPLLDTQFDQLALRQPGEGETVPMRATAGADVEAEEHAFIAPTSETVGDPQGRFFPQLGQREQLLSLGVWTKAERENVSIGEPIPASHDGGTNHFGEDLRVRLPAILDGRTKYAPTPGGDGSPRAPISGHLAEETSAAFGRQRPGARRRRGRLRRRSHLRPAWEPPASPSVAQAGCLSFFRPGVARNQEERGCSTP